MVASLLTGWSVMINTQRYKDTVNTTYAFLQSQYNLVYNVENNRDETLKCNGNTVQNSDGINPTQRGQSDCVLLGRYLRLTDGVTFKSYPIVGKDVQSDTASEYQPKVVSPDFDIGLSENTLTVPWGAVVKGGGVHREEIQTIAIVLLRSPQFGTVNTYSFNTTSGGNPVLNLADLNTANEAERLLCFDPGATIAGPRQAVVIRAHASSQNAIETIPGEGKC
jgi:hypothetical protein